MFGVALDIYVGYLFRIIDNWYKSRGSSRWSTAEAVVTASPTESQGYGGPTVEIVYSYRFKGELYTGIHEEPFLRGDSIAEYVNRFPEGRRFVIRVNATDPQVSTVRDEDQPLLTQTEQTRAVG